MASGGSSVNDLTTCTSTIIIFFLFIVIITGLKRALGYFTTRYSTNKSILNGETAFELAQKCIPVNDVAGEVACPCARLEVFYFQVVKRPGGVVPEGSGRYASVRRQSAEHLLKVHNGYQSMKIDSFTRQPLSLWKCNLCSFVVFLERTGRMQLIAHRGGFGGLASYFHHFLLIKSGSCPFLPYFLLLSHVPSLPGASDRSESLPWDIKNFIRFT